MTFFSVWTLPEKEISNSFHAPARLNSRTKCHQKKVKGPRFTDNKILDVQTHYKPTETFQYTHFSSSHSLSVKKVKKGFIKGETLRLLRTNSVKEIFELRKREFLTCLLERAFRREPAENSLAEVKFSSRNEALQDKAIKKCFAFHHVFQPSYV